MGGRLEKVIGSRAAICDSKGIAFERTAAVYWNRKIAGLTQERVFSSTDVLGVSEKALAKGNSPPSGHPSAEIAKYSLERAGADSSEIGY